VDYTRQRLFVEPLLCLEQGSKLLILGIERVQQFVVYIQSMYQHGLDEEPREAFYKKSTHISTCVQFSNFLECQKARQTVDIYGAHGGRDLGIHVPVQYVAESSVRLEKGCICRGGANS
jgi:hypothetical protein